MTRAKRLLLIPAFILLTLTGALADAAFDRFIQSVQAEARDEGIDAAYLEALGRLTPDPEIIRLSERQPEYVKPIWAYLDIMVTDERLRLGRAELQKWDEFLGQLESRYGVPRGIIVAIWGVETNYGANKGSFPVLQALATLGYQGKRAAFGRQQLLAALDILQSGDVALADFKGSWAGAMGHTQFIPTTYLGYAADGTGDGIRNIWTQPRDALASTANYLKVSGWRAGLPWGVEVNLPDGFDFGLADLKRYEPVSLWQEKGVTAHIGKLHASLGEMALFAPAGHRGPAFLVTRNFRALLRYNTAPAYALAVGHLADRFDGLGDIARAWPLGDRPLLPREITELQRQLAAKGYDTGDADGVLGRLTRRAVRQYQAAENLVADGYATPGLLTHLMTK
jgi:membrane-bound lytic murein transglycosylase B